MKIEKLSAMITGNGDYHQKNRLHNVLSVSYTHLNALNTIKWIAVLNKQENIQHLIESLIYIFRNAARVDDESYTVQDELKLIENYAVIQKARFMNFELMIEADEICICLLYTSRCV